MAPQVRILLRPPYHWHGGKHLLAGLEFYRKAVEIQHTWEKQDPWDKGHWANRK